MDSYVREIDACRSCGNADLDPILSLGEQYVSDFVDSPDDQTVKAPLELVLCDASTGGCGLLQLEHTVDPNYLYSEYWYKSGINESMRESLRSVAEDATHVAELEENDLILDIGCNDGTMLRMFDEDCRRVGFEPAENLVSEAREGTTRVINDFFTANSYEEALGDEPADLVTSIAMFYDLDEPNEFVSNVKSILADDGVWVIQMAYLPEKIETNAFDSIVHEHLEYYSLLALENLLERHSLEVFDMETNDVNGGSFRVYIRHNGADVSGFDGARERLDSFRKYEADMGLHSQETYDAFADRVQRLKEQTRTFIEDAVADGENVYVYGASTKGNTLLQYYGLDHTLIEAAAERNPDKYGKLTVGTQIPIVSEEEARPDADYFLALPWHFMDAFLEREADFLRNGGKFIKPLPEFELLGAEDIPE